MDEMSRRETWLILQITFTENFKADNKGTICWDWPDMSEVLDLQTYILYILIFLMSLQDV